MSEKLLHVSNHYARIRHEGVVFIDGHKILHLRQHRALHRHFSIVGLRKGDIQKGIDAFGTGDDADFQRDGLEGCRQALRSGCGELLSGRTRR